MSCVALCIPSYGYYLKLIMMILYHTAQKEPHPECHLTVPTSYFKWILTYNFFNAFIFQEVSMTIFWRSQNGRMLTQE